MHSRLCGSQLNTKADWSGWGTTDDKKCRLKASSRFTFYTLLRVHLLHVLSCSSVVMLVSSEWVTII